MGVSTMVDTLRLDNIWDPLSNIYNIVASKDSFLDHYGIGSPFWSRSTSDGCKGNFFLMVILMKRFTCNNPKFFLVKELSILCVSWRNLSMAWSKFLASRFSIVVLEIRGNYHFYEVCGEQDWSWHLSHDQRE